MFVVSGMAVLLLYPGVEVLMNMTSGRNNLSVVGGRVFSRPDIISPATRSKQVSNPTHYLHTP